MTLSSAKPGRTRPSFSKSIVGAGQQGKYFWIAMSAPPHPVMHLGMAGWLKIRNADTPYYQPEKSEDKEWPPKYWKFLLETDDDPKTELHSLTSAVWVE
ncbi:formamidopyrimidine-DNA glycosylase [Aspergillus sclerotialis]|uniref:Formamidopyrimidine-DNA glycosylase n=1 Tax=Aspergillus sclerotialis TaxID=2070753 RepID=A0A3A2Z3H4_9EURO|nr:formamidopyrimidine-DNA glycosylase [Aspergillus sclerotialis]